MFNKPGFWIGLVLVSLAGIFFYVFREEFNLLWRFVRYFFGYTLDLDRLAVRLAFVTILENLFALAFFFLGSVLIVSQFVLPVQTLSERGQVLSRMLLYLRGKHGPAVFIKDGRKVGSQEELRLTRPGVAFVDLNSAIALERSWVPVAGAGQGSRGRGRGGGLSGLGRLMRMPFRMFRRSSRPQKAGPLVRVAGPGIVFTNWGERIRGVGDLRPQTRSAKDVGVSTRDGFDIRTSVSVNFTIGAPAEEWWVTQAGDRPEDLRAVIPDGLTGTVRDLTDEFDDLDKQEIFRFVQTYAPNPRVNELMESEGRRPINPPFEFNADRVFAAVYARADRVNADEFVEWTELPLRVAVEVFRDLLSKETFDSLYLPKEETEFPLGRAFREKFSQKMRNLGILAYRYVVRRDGKPIEKGQRWDEKALKENIDPELAALPLQQLQAPKVLRDRGIKVLGAGFGELAPTHTGVRTQLVDYWRAHWQRQAEITEAEYFIKAMKERAHARAMTQRDMVYTLSQIMNMPDLSQEALTLQLFQALDAIASEPQTHQLLPEETINLLSNFQTLLLPGGWAPPRGGPQT